MSGLSITIPGQPYAQKRHRARVAGKGAKQWVSVYDHPDNVAFRDRAQLHFWEAIKGKPGVVQILHSEGPLRLGIAAFWQCPKSQERKREPRLLRYKTGRPDCDNCAKAIMDAGNGILWADDAQVVELEVSKFIAAQGDAPRTVVRIERLGENLAPEGQFFGEESK